MEERVETGVNNVYTRDYMNAERGSKKATASLVLGILSVVFPGVIGLVLGIIGVIEASKAKKLGNMEGNRTAGFVLSLVGLIYSIILILIAIICFVAIATFFAQLISAYSTGMEYYNNGVQYYDMISQYLY